MSLARSLVKLANGDMLQYFLDHPEKLKEKQKRDKNKKEKTAKRTLEQRKQEEKQYEDLEAAYWRFDAYQGHQNGEYKHRPMSDRDAFKKAVRPLLEKIAEVVPYQQSTDWTCSAACLKAVLGHYGVDVPEEICVRVIGTRKGRGAECNEIMWGAHKLGFDAFEFSFDSIEQAKTLADKDIPIIADIQSFNHPGKGHYVVVTGIDDDIVHLMDPNTPGNERHLSSEEMDDRWWDHTMQAPHTLMMKHGIVILPPENEAIK